MNLNQLAADIASSDWSKDTSGGAPVHLWSPNFCGDIPLKILSDGTWTYQNSPFTRAKLVSLFASVLKYEDGRYFLVTPAEKVGIEVEDVPFVVTQWQQTSEGIIVSTQSNEQFVINDDHPVECRTFPSDSDNIVPYVCVRTNLWARFHQNVFYQMIDSANIVEKNGQSEALLNSGDYQFSLGSF